MLPHYCTGYSLRVAGTHGLLAPLWVLVPRL